MFVDFSSDMNDELVRETTVIKKDERHFIFLVAVIVVHLLLIADVFKYSEIVEHVSTHIKTFHLMVCFE